jgi:hypothetical protein
MLLTDGLAQLEVARAAEMQTHGLHIRELQREADASAESEKQLRLELARLRTDQCRLEVEAAVASRRMQQALEAADAQRDAHSKVNSGISVHSRLVLTCGVLL